MIKKILKHSFILCNRYIFRHFGHNSYISPFGIYSHKNKIYIGDNVYIGPHAILSAKEGLFIGNGVIAGPGLIVMGGDHNFKVVGKRIFEISSGGKNEKVIIEDDVWLGARVTILKGVTIGEGAIIGAGAVLTKDVTPYAIAAGNPGRVIKPRFSSSQLKEHLMLTNSKYKYYDIEPLLYH